MFELLVNVFMSPVDQHNLAQRQRAASRFAHSYRVKDDAGGLRRVIIRNTEWGQNSVEAHIKTRLNMLICFRVSTVLWYGPSSINQRFYRASLSPGPEKRQI